MQVVMTKTLTGYDVVYWFMSRCHNKDISNCHICIKNVITERMTLNELS